MGAGLTAVGVLFLLLGVLFLFDGPLLAMGDVRLGQGAQAPDLRSLHTKTPATHSRLCHTQLLVLSGVATTLGPVASWKFFTKRRNYKGSGAFGAGVLLVLAKWPVIGMASQFYGFLLLFADFLPTALPLARRMPVLGYVLSLPPVKAATSKLLSLSKSKGTDKLPT